MQITRARCLPILLRLVPLLIALPAAAGPLRVTATTPDLGSLVESVGGEDVEVTTLVRGGQDPHFIEARPSFIRLLSRTDLFVTVGLQLELGWVPPLLRNARNTRILPGAEGALDASKFVPLLGVVTTTVDRSMGDVHARGNPHYLLDPVNGLRVARAIRDTLARLRPERAEAFREREAAFEKRLLSSLVGADVLASRDPERVAEAVLEDRLSSLVPEAEVGGWLGLMRPHHGRAVVSDHDLWRYFTARFGIRVAAFLEPLPGITPTTRHLSAVAEQMKAEDVRAIFSAAYFHPRYARKVAEATGAKVIEMANQVGAREGVDDYLAMIDWNVRHVADAL